MYKIIKEKNEKLEFFCLFVKKKKKNLKSHNVLCSTSLKFKKKNLHKKIMAAKPVSFTWKKDINADIYTVDENKTSFNAKGDRYYRPSIADIEFKPNTGKYYYELIINNDNVRVGVCTPGCDTSAIMGEGSGLYSLNMQTGACESAGQEKKKLWRIVTPCCGGRLGFVWDSDNGTLQGWFNGEFIGTMFHEAFNLKGQTVSPCVGIAGIEENNRNIGEGMKCVVVEKNPEAPSVTFS